MTRPRSQPSSNMRAHCVSCFHRSPSARLRSCSFTSSRNICIAQSHAHHLVFMRPRDLRPMKANTELTCRHPHHLLLGGRKLKDTFPACVLGPLVAGWQQVTFVPTAVMRTSGNERAPPLDCQRPMNWPRLRPVLYTSTPPDRAALSSQYEQNSRVPASASSPSPTIVPSRSLTWSHTVHIMHTT